MGYDLLRYLNKLHEHLGLVKVIYTDPAIVVPADFLRVKIPLDPPHIKLNPWCFIVNPQPLSLFMCLYRPCSEMLDVFVKHLLLQIILGPLLSKSQVLADFHQILGELTILKSNFPPLKFMHNSFLVY